VDGPRQNYYILSEKIIKKKRAGGMAKAVEHLPNKRKALSSNPSTAKEKKRKGKKKKKAKP
jgi:hypothetical protein